MGKLVRLFVSSCLLECIVRRFYIYEIWDTRCGIRYGAGRGLVNARDIWGYIVPCFTAATWTMRLREDIASGGFFDSDDRRGILEHFGGTLG